MAAPANIPEITVHELKALLENDEAPFLLDVRRPDEHAFVNIGGTLIPLQEISTRLDELEAYKEAPMVVYCRSGARSGQAVAYLRAMGFHQAMNLKGGMLAWSREIDPSKPTY